LTPFTLFFLTPVSSSGDGHFFFAFTRASFIAPSNPTYLLPNSNESSPTVNSPGANSGDNTLQRINTP
jgi:hypothetical protein